MLNLKDDLVIEFEGNKYNYVGSYQTRKNGKTTSEKYIFQHVDFMKVFDINPKHKILKSFIKKFTEKQLLTMLK